MTDTTRPDGDVDEVVRLREEAARLRTALQAMVDNTYVGKPGTIPNRSKYGHFEARYYHAAVRALEGSSRG